MSVELEVKLADFRRAVRRLLTRLPDERGTGCDVIAFDVRGISLEIQAGNTTETVEAQILRPGRALPFHHSRVISISFRTATVRINQTEYRHPDISVQPI